MHENKLLSASTSVRIYCISQFTCLLEPEKKMKQGTTPIKKKFKENVNSTDLN